MKLLPNWKVLSPQIDNQPTPLEPGAQEPRAQLSSLIYSYQSQKEKLEAALASHKDTLTLRFPALRSSDPSHPSTSRLPPPEAIEPSRGRERSKSPDVPCQRRHIDEPARLEPTNEEAAPSPVSLSPTAEEFRTLSLNGGTHALFPETWTRQYGNKGSLVHLAKTGRSDYMTKDFEPYKGSIYVYFEDYHGSGTRNSLAAQLHDHYRSTGTYGYHIHQQEGQTDVVLAYQPDKETNVLALLDNQNRASEQFPESEPRVTRPIHVNELHLVERISAWGELDTEQSLLTST
jgi:hypothetical protein